MRRILWVVFLQAWTFQNSPIEYFSIWKYLSPENHEAHQLSINNFFKNSLGGEECKNHISPVSKSPVSKFSELNVFTFGIKNIILTSLRQTCHWCWQLLLGGDFRWRPAVKTGKPSGLVEIKAWLWCAGYTHEVSSRKPAAGWLGMRFHSVSAQGLSPWRAPRRSWRLRSSRQPRAPRQVPQRNGQDPQVLLLEGDRGTLCFVNKTWH